MALRVVEDDPADPVCVDVGLHFAGRQFYRGFTHLLLVVAILGFCLRAELDLLGSCQRLARAREVRHIDHFAFEADRHATIGLCLGKCGDQPLCLVQFVGRWCKRGVDDFDLGWMDGDLAGRKSALKGVKLCQKIGLEAKVVLLARKEDPFDLCKNNSEIEILKSLDIELSSKT